MTKLISITPAKDGIHKYTALFETSEGRRKTTHFGAKGYDDYTLTHNNEQRERYRMRHQKDLRTNDPTKAGYLSYYILWNKETVHASIADYKNKFNL